MNSDVFKTSRYDWQIPEKMIAQCAVSPRDSSKLLVIDSKKSSMKTRVFRDIIEYFKKGDVLVLNNTKVIKARLMGEKPSGSKIEVLLLRQVNQGVWKAMVKPGKRVRVGDIINFRKGLEAKVIEKSGEGLRMLEFNSNDIKRIIEKIGKVPLPPYIKKETEDFGHYQTVYAKKDGAVAAPTAGLHFTKELLDKLKNKGVKIVYVTLHCGLATFRPVKTQDIRDHKLSSEWIEVSQAVANIINSAKRENSRIIAVGTTAIRTLESLAFSDKEERVFIKPYCGETNLYILPGYKFKIVDNVITNFHTPCSTNLVLITCFCGYDLLKQSYEYAKTNNFRFFSLGDAMLII